MLLSTRMLELSNLAVAIANACEGADAHRIVFPLVMTSMAAHAAMLPFDFPGLTESAA